MTECQSDLESSQRQATHSAGREWLLMRVNEGQKILEFFQGRKKKSTSKTIHQQWRQIEDIVDNQNQR